MNEEKLAGEVAKLGVVAVPFNMFALNAVAGSIHSLHYNLRLPF